MDWNFVDHLAPDASCQHLLLIAPKSAFGPRRLTSKLLDRLLGKEAAVEAQALGNEANPGALGGLATSRTRGGMRLTVAALADSMSRHNSPARAEAIRKVTAAAGLDTSAVNEVLLLLESPDHLLAALNAVGRGMPGYSRKSGTRRRGKLTIGAATMQGKPISIPSETADTVRTSMAMAELVDMPPGELHPTSFSSRARAMLKPLRGVKVKELVGDSLLRSHLGGIHAVGRAAVEPPRLLLATSGPRRGGPHIALVGKGITYDTGGLHLKARGSMEGMKADMGGAAAVLGAFLLLARHRAPCRISLLLCLAENAVAANAYKPDDILTLHSGKTVEINNTDAEGRLLLADGCSYAARVLGADIVLDAATLTGAQGVATGDVHAALVSNDVAVEQALIEAGRNTGDLCWPLPFAPELYRAEFRSPIADMRNSVKNRSNAQVSCAAEFIHWHLEGTQVRWGHLDLASPAFRNDRGTGFGVALLADAVRRLGVT